MRGRSSGMKALVLKAYKTKNDWQAQFTNFKNSMFNKMQFMMEQLDVPVEGRQKSTEPGQQKGKATNEKSSSLRLLPA